MARYLDSQDDEDTIEMELTPEQLHLLAEAAAISGAGADDDEPRSDPPPIVVVKPPEIIITVEVGPAAVKPIPTMMAASSRQPIVIEHVPTAKLKPPKPAPPVVVPAPATPAARPIGRRINSQLRGALIAGVVAIAAFMSTIAYVAVTRARPTDVPVFTIPQLPRETAAMPSPPLVVEPVKFSNPFDESEVFEFPAGTTETEARDAVATMLLQRAQERLDQAEARQRRNVTRPTKLASRD
jgi:hypothetical protein